MNTTKFEDELGLKCETQYERNWNYLKVADEVFPWIIITVIRSKMSCSHYLIKQH